MLGGISNLNGSFNLFEWRLHFESHLGTSILTSTFLEPVFCSRTLCVSIFTGTFTFGNNNRGPYIKGPDDPATWPSFYYYWDGVSTTHWPAHDPCGQNQPNHLTGVNDPWGAIYVE